MNEQIKQEDKNFQRDILQRKKEADDKARADAPSDWDQIFGIVKTVAPVIMGLGKPKKTGKGRKVYKYGEREAEIEANRQKRIKNAQIQNDIDDKKAFANMTAEDLKEYNDFLYMDQRLLINLIYFVIILRLSFPRNYYL